MAFNFEDYERKCQSMTTQELHTAWENYKREVLERARSIATSVLLSPVTAAHTALARKGGFLGKTYEYYRKNSIDQEGPQKHGYEPTPLAVSTNMTTIEDVTEQVANLDIKQDLSNHYATPHAGLHHTNTWPAKYQAHLLNHDTGLGSHTTAQNSLQVSGRATQDGVSRSMSIKSITIRNGQNKSTTMTIDEETLFIRGRLLQLEMIRRGDELQAFSQNETQAQQTTELEVLVEDEVSENTGTNQVYTSFQFWNRSPVQQSVPSALPPTPTPAASLPHSGNSPGSQSGSILQAQQIFPTISQELVCPLGQILPAQNSVQLVSTPIQTILPVIPEYQNPSIPHAQNQYSAYSQQAMCYPGQTTSSQSPPQVSISSTQVIPPTVPEYQSPPSAAAQHQHSSYTRPAQPLRQNFVQPQDSTATLPPQAQEQRPENNRKESQDSGYFSAPPSFGLPPTAEIPDDEETDDFIPQGFGLPPETVIPHLSEQHHIEPILSASDLSPVVERSLDFPSWAPPETSQPEPPESQQTNEETKYSLSSTSQEPRLDCHGSQPYFSYENNQINAAPSLPLTAPVASRNLDFQSWVPPETSQRTPPGYQSVEENNARHSVSTISKQESYASPAYMPYKPPDAQSQAYRDTRSQSVPIFPWKDPQDQGSQYPFSPITPVPEQEPRYIAYSPS